MDEVDKLVLFQESMIASFQFLKDVQLEMVEE